MPFPKHQPRAEKRHNVQKMMMSGYDFPPQELNLGTKVKVIRDNGSKATNYISDELSLEKYMGMKRKPSTYFEKRNHLTMANPGDKTYCAVEYSPDFYKKEGGIIPGSCIASKRKSAFASFQAGNKNNNRSTDEYGFTIDKNISQMINGLNYRPRLSFEQKRRIKDLSDDIDSVCGLTESSLMGEEINKSWEEKTGLFTVSPEEAED